MKKVFEKMCIVTIAVMMFCSVSVSEAAASTKTFDKKVGGHGY